MITCFRHYHCLVPRRLSLNENSRAKEGGKKKTVLLHQSLEFRVRLYAKPCKKRSAWGGGSHYDFLVLLVLEWRGLSRFLFIHSFIHEQVHISSSCLLTLPALPNKLWMNEWIKWMTTAVMFSHRLCIPASSLRHSLLNGVFSVLFKKRGRSVLCVISEFFVCLLVCFYTVS